AHVLTEVDQFSSSFHAAGDPQHPPIDTSPGQPLHRPSHSLNHRHRNRRHQNPLLKWCCAALRHRPKPAPTPRHVEAAAMRGLVEEDHSSKTSSPAKDHGFDPSRSQYSSQATIADPSGNS